MLRVNASKVKRDEVGIIGLRRWKSQEGDGQGRTGSCFHQGHLEPQIQERVLPLDTISKRGAFFRSNEGKGQELFYQLVNVVCGNELQVSEVGLQSMTSTPVIPGPGGWRSPHHSPNGDLRNKGQGRKVQEETQK
jgi:hypothetical protein